MHLCPQRDDGFMTTEGRKIWFNGATLVILLAGTWFVQWTSVKGNGCGPGT